jgi:histone-arginine methyltransferase CARM1
MIQDQVRTDTYYKAVMNNTIDFKNKTVIDVGAGTGLLSFFTSMAGAKVVFAIEASDSAEYCRVLISKDNLEERIFLIKGLIEDESTYKIIKSMTTEVDVIISEPLGILLVNERMIESYIKARDLFLKPGGRLFPSKSIIHLIPFTDETVYNEYIEKVSFWKHTQFYNIDLSSLYDKALKEKFSQPVLEAYNPSCHVADKTSLIIFDYYSISLSDLTDFSSELSFTINRPCFVHGLACWFDTIFDGTSSQIVLSTSPRSPVTHWFQVRFFFEKPMEVNKNQKIIGKVRFIANDYQSYRVEISMKYDDESMSKYICEGVYELKNCEYRGCG